MTDSLSVLIVDLLDGAFEAPLWKTFLERLRQLAGATYVTLVCQSPRGRIDEALYLIAGDATVDDALNTFREFRYPDALSRRFLPPEGRPFSLAEIMEQDGASHPAFFARLVNDLRLTAVLQMRVREPSGVDAWLSVIRHGPDFGEDEKRLLTDLAPILRGVMRNYVAREQERFAAEMAGDAVRRLQFGWISLDADGTIISADQFGDLVLATSEVLRRDNSGRIAVKPAGLQRELDKVVARLAMEPLSRPRAIQLRGDPWLDMLLVPARHRPLAGAGATAVIAYVHGDNWSSSDRQSQLSELFSLKPSEAKLALALCRGKSIAEAAREIGLTVESARTYSKAIFAKTGAKGQPDLVRIIMGSILALAPDG